MTLSEEIVLNTCFTVFIILMIYFKYVGILKSNLDYFLAMLAILISILLLFIKSAWAVDLAHFLYGFIYLCIVTFISKNIYLLALNVLMVVLIILSRYYYGYCILNKKQNDVGFFYNLNTFIQRQIGYESLGDFIYLSYIVISLYRFFKLL